jgi:hypothetical protein
VRAAVRVATKDTEDEGVVTRVSLELSPAGLATQAYDGDYVRGAARASREAREAREAEREAREAGVAIEEKGAREGADSREAREARKLDRRDRPRYADHARGRERPRSSSTTLAASDAAAFLGEIDISESRTRRRAAVTQDDGLGRKVPGQGVPDQADGLRLFLSPGITGYTGVSHLPHSLPPSPSPSPSP